MNSYVLDLYDPTLDEHREDGLGSGQAHRTGANFRPSPSDGYMRGRGFARGGSHQRTRSLSPLPPRGRGRGRTLDLGTRGPSRAPPQAPPRSTPSDRGLPEEPFNMRSIKPRVQQRAMDDLSLPMMPATKAEPSDPVIGQ